MEEENSTKAVASLRRCGHILYHHIGEKRGQTRVLELLTEKKTLPQQQILEQLGVQPGSGSELLSKLEGRGLGSALVLEFLLYYLTRPEYQIHVREAIYLDNMLDLF